MVGLALWQAMQQPDSNQLAAQLEASSWLDLWQVLGLKCRHATALCSSCAVQQHGICHATSLSPWIRGLTCGTAQTQRPQPQLTGRKTGGGGQQSKWR